MILSQFGRRVGFSGAERTGVDVRRAVGVAGLALLLLACEREEKMVREDLPMARTTKARSDAQAIATAVNGYRASCGGSCPSRWRP